MRVIEVFGAAHAHHAYCFTHRSANRLKVLVHDGLGIWLSVRRLNERHFRWAELRDATELSLSREQFDARVLGLLWQRLGAGVDFTAPLSQKPSCN